ncbi:MAG TPA: hypothetical protein VFO41_06120 [Alphaproteobacteria bacterium]|nr:hypothetical protein [Alphaproteobacteria bacterium]
MTAPIRRRHTAVMTGVPPVMPPHMMQRMSGPAVPGGGERARGGEPVANPAL